jgi:hypothetical protein
MVTFNSGSTFARTTRPQKEQAEQLVNGHDVELWHLNRRICEVKSKE